MVPHTNNRTPEEYPHLAPDSHKPILTLPEHARSGQATQHTWYLLAGHFAAEGDRASKMFHPNITNMKKAWTRAHGCA